MKKESAYGYAILGLLVLALIPILSIPAFAQVTLGNMSMSSVGKLPVRTMVTGTVSDGSEKVMITTAPPVADQPLSIQVDFAYANGNPVQHQNYEIEAIQDGHNVLSNTAGHTHTGTDVQSTSALYSTNPVNVKVTLMGVGLPGTDPATWTGPKGAAVIFSVVPEFGNLVSIILIVAIVAVIFGSKSGLFLKT